MDDWVVNLLETNEAVQQYAPEWASIVDPCDTDPKTNGGAPAPTSPPSSAAPADQQPDAEAAAPAQPTSQAMPPNEKKNKAEFSLYYYPHCYYSQKVAMLLHLKGIRFHRHLVDLNEGEQFDEDFARLNPRCEVPVLHHRGIHHYVQDSARITSYLQKNYPQPFLLPYNSELRSRHDKLLARIEDIPIEALTYGSLEYTAEQLGLEEPQPPYDEPDAREAMREALALRPALLHTEAHNLEQELPKASEALLVKIRNIHEELLPTVQDYRKYQSILEKLDSLLDDVETQLCERGVPFLFGRQVTLADVGLGLLLHRLWQLGFAKRFWECRTGVGAYLDRIRALPSFRKATDREGEDDSDWPVFFTALAGCTMLVGYTWFVIALWTGSDSETGAAGKS